MDTGATTVEGRKTNDVRIGGLNASVHLQGGKPWEKWQTSKLKQKAVVATDA